MSNFILEITHPQTSILEIETSFIESINNLEIETSLIENIDSLEISFLDIETNFIQNINSLEISRSESFNIELINTEKILASDLPDNIPISKIVGNLSVARISGLDDYLDNYEFDCGSP